MTEPPNISELLRRTMQTNIGFYADLVDISANYLKNLSNIFDETSNAANEKEQPEKPRSESTVLVLEAEAGETAEGYFMVENQLTRKVPADIVASPIVDANDHQIAQKLQFEPTSINLEPGEKIVVQVTADIDQTLEPGTGYRGTITVPGLSDTPAAIVIRRRHGDEDADVVASPKPKRAKRRTAKSKSPRASSARKK